MENIYIAEFYRSKKSSRPEYRTILNGVVLSEPATYNLNLGQVSRSDIYRVADPVENPELLEIMSICDWERIELTCSSEEDGTTDNSLMLTLGNSLDHDDLILVEFEGNWTSSIVKFSKGCRQFRVRLSRLQKKFQVRTMFEVMEYLKEYYSSISDISQIEEMFSAGIDDAVKLVSNLFEGRVDLDGNPDIIHVLSVGMAGSTRNEKLVGFLHDVIEDTGYTAEDLLCDGYSMEVVEAVLLLTRDESIPYMDYVKSIIESGNRLALKVKVNDLKHNIARGKAGGNHNHLVVMHEVALAYITSKIAA